MTESASLEKVKETYNTLVQAREENTIRMLRLRADVAAAIHNAHKDGYSNYAIAKYLGIDRTQVGRLDVGLWLPPGRKHPVSAAVWPPEPSDVPPPAPTPVEGSKPSERLPRPLTVCRYCSGEATHALRFNDGKIVLVCKTHLPRKGKK